ncbi:hypothetical protein [Dyella subtropica]|uniref:hypothetical protein n=1 Tax=Dyella subtropica TaxID=2992127 RepID=UPI00224D2896|nr:hypothetical protein [Dyella subtropica]
MQILSDRREGLLVELGRLVVANGFTLLRQRLSQDSKGTWLVMIVRGPAERQLVLEEALATHNRVLSFEAALAERDALPAPSSPVARLLAAEAIAPAAGPDVRQVESTLPQLAHDYPKIYPWLITLEHAVAADAREASLQLAGRRTGAWVYKRDYAMGAKLGLADAIKRIAMPALRELATVDWRDGQLHIQNSPLCSPGGDSGCRFFSGYLEGVLGGSVAPQTVFARSLYCRSTGAVNCILEISH